MNAPFSTKIIEALRDQTILPTSHVLETIGNYHRQLRESDHTITSLRNERLEKGGFETVSLSQGSRRLVEVVTLQVNQALLLYRLVRALRPTIVVEIGTGAGTSGALMLAAMHDNGEGQLITLDGAPEMAELAQQLFSRLGFSSRVTPFVGIFNDTVPKIRQMTDRVDFAFIDDEHRYESTMRDMECLVPLMPEDSAIVFDDIGWGGAREAWQDLSTRPDCAFAYSLDYRGSSRLGLWAKGRGNPHANYPQSLELMSPYFLAPFWKIARGIANRVLRK